MAFIPFLFLKAFLSMASQRIESFILVLLVLFLLTIPLGYLIIKAFRLFPKSNFFDRLSLSFGIGLGIVLILCLWTMLIKFSALLICFELILIDLSLFWYCWEKNLFFSEYSIKKVQPHYLRFLVWGFLIIMFVYYSLVPLTTDLAMFRDYDLIAWGIQENSALKLPIYNIETYYPPGSSLITGLINLIIPSVHIPKIMLNLAYFFAFYIFILFYQFSKLGFRNKHLGFFLMLAWAISPVSRNFVTGGSTIPGNLSVIMGLLCFLFILFYFNKQQKRYLFFGSLILGACAISHADGLIIFLWGILVLTLSKLIMNRKDWLRIGFFFMGLAVISLFIASPFILHAMNGKLELEEFWTKEKWTNYAKGEPHPKPLDEVMFFAGRWLSWLSLLGIPYIFWLLLKLKDWKKPVMISLLLWPALMFASNNFTFLKIAKPFILFYAINIIMWAGISIPITLIVGFGFEGIRKLLIDKKTLLFLFFIFLLGLVFIKIIDYETINKENVFNRQQGFLMQSFAQRNAYFNQGDINLINWFNDQKFEGVILNPNSWISLQMPIISKKNSTSIFLHHFYDSLEDIKKPQEKMQNFQKIFTNPHQELINLEKEMIRYIFIPSTFSFNNTLIEKYEIVQRDSGSKILAPKLKSNLKHYEIEDYSSKQKHYKYGDLIDIKITELNLCETIQIYLEWVDKNKENYTVYVKHLTFLLPLNFEINVGDKKFEISKTTDKLTWSESSVNLTKNDLEKANWTIKVIGKSNGIDLKIKKYLPEIDWIEIES